MDYRELLVAPVAYLAPDKILEGLDEELAEARQAGAPHSIAELVAHLVFWQEWFSDRCAGRATPVAASAAQGWPTVAPGTWAQLCKRFLKRLQQFAEVSAETASTKVSPAIEFPPLAHYTVGDALIHVATHNSHHLGQIVLLRQLQGTWPPPAGSWTW